MYWRDRKEMLIALFMPLALIMVLGFALPNWVEMSRPSYSIKAALVNMDHTEEGIQDFQYTLQNMPMLDTEKEAIRMLAEHTEPSTIFMQWLEHDEVKTYLEIVESDDKDQASRLLEAKEVDAIIHIPEDFTSQTLKRMLLNEGEGAALTIIAEEPSNRQRMLEDVLHSFIEQFNYSAALGYASSDQAGMDTSTNEQIYATIGGVESVEGAEMITSFQYFALAICIFFVMSVAVTTAAKGITEKREQVFMRIMLSGAHPYHYLGGKVTSTFFMALLQFTVLILLSHFIFGLFPGRPLSFWAGMGILIVVYCVVMAAFSAVHTALVFRMKDTDLASGISMIVFIVLGIIGGSLVPLYILPDWLLKIGSQTPNGLALTTLLQWIQLCALDLLWGPVGWLLLYAVVFIAAGLWIFPGRGRS